MIDIMEQSPFGSRRVDGPDLDLKEVRISRENTNSRRILGSNSKSFREDSRSFRSNFTVSSTISSPGYTTRDEIYPSTYSFTTALRALQANTWEYMSPNGYTLNSKWNEAEKYICNPLSGKVPLECLSAKSLSGRNRITMSAPLIYPSHLQPLDAKSLMINQHQNHTKIKIQESKRKSTRDVGTQSTPVDISSGSLSPVSTPEIKERSINHSPLSSINGKLEKEVEEVKESRVEEHNDKMNEGERKKIRERKMFSSCLSLKDLWMITRHKTRKEGNNSTKPSTLPCHINGC